ncbi:hypothetical protein HPG69_011968 [Diceros bicornis minor]|uniref:Uncharacterized protein n=1 Tax=Diceros bicornis minor TaxID=77932 RepID=A0A7J7EE14_DICBM|nr:hypothetical protein HPG69_011968 [Diceros bicornis minor]
MEAVLNELVSVDDLLKFEKKFQSEKAAGSVSKSTQSEYAWCLVRSKYNNDIREGIALLEGLRPKGAKRRSGIMSLPGCGGLPAQAMSKGPKACARAAAHRAPEQPGQGTGRAH